MGGIVGSGIFMNPALVAREVHTPALILGAWLAGGVIAVLGAFVWAELASRRPQVGGQYAYLREAYHPVLGFVYGWGFLLVTLSGVMMPSGASRSQRSIVKSCSNLLRSAAGCSPGGREPRQRF